MSLHTAYSGEGFRGGAHYRRLNEKGLRGVNALQLESPVQPEGDLKEKAFDSSVCTDAPFRTPVASGQVLREYGELPSIIKKGREGFCAPLTPMKFSGVNLDRSLALAAKEGLEEAYSIVEMDGALDKNQELCGLCKGLFFCGLVNEAVEVTGLISNDVLKNILFSRFSLALAKKKDFASANDIASRISNGIQKSEAIQNISFYL